MPKFLSYLTGLWICLFAKAASPISDWFFARILKSQCEWIANYVALTQEISIQKLWEDLRRNFLRFWQGIAQSVHSSLWIQNRLKWNSCYFEFHNRLKFSYHNIPIYWKLCYFSWDFTYNIQMISLLKITTMYKIINYHLRISYYIEFNKGIVILLSNKENIPNGNTLVFKLNKFCFSKFKNV